MKVIFLDIDGVLNSRAYDRERDMSANTDIDESRLPLVKRIVDATGAVIVLSSTWRRGWEKNGACDGTGEYINATFAAHGLAIADKTPDLGFAALRADEVRAWLDGATGVDRFVIIDDDAKGWGELAERLVKTSPYFGRGLEEEHVAAAIALLGGAESNN